ncbi:MAG: enoyl-CoA hydratase/isomerase family protein, partial [Chloroflexi bacterium]|nr:enoyl-CoA hydratase/isomerase family protein [Chloroflexota bacterium]
MANDDSLLVDISDGVATVTFNRPHRLNAMNSEMLTDLVPNLWPKLQKDKAVRVVILTGAGDRAFSSGLDVKEAAQTPPSTRRGSRSNLG